MPYFFSSFFFQITHELFINWPHNTNEAYAVKTLWHGTALNFCHVSFNLPVMFVSNLSHIDVVLWEKHSNELQCHRKVQPQFQFFIKCYSSTPYTSIWILYATYKMGTKFVEKCKNWKHIKWRMKCDQT